MSAVLHRRRSAPRALVAAGLVLAALVIEGSRTATGPATLHAAGEPDKPLLSVRITAPLGRLGLPGAVRIVAQVNHPPQVALESVGFYVNDTLLGDDREGRPACSCSPTRRRSRMA